MQNEEENKMKSFGRDHTNSSPFAFSLWGNFRVDLFDFFLQFNANNTRAELSLRLLRVTLSAPMSSRRLRHKIIIFFDQKCQNINFHDHIWNHLKMHSNEYRQAWYWLSNS